MFLFYGSEREKQVICCVEFPPVKRVQCLRLVGMVPLTGTADAAHVNASGSVRFPSGARRGRTDRKSVPPVKPCGLPPWTRTIQRGRIRVR